MSKSDKELLELAAKSIWRNELIFNNGDSNAYYAGSKFYMTKHLSHTPWNPLTDDGDALRLAVKLKIDIEMYIDEVWTNSKFGNVQNNQLFEWHGGDEVKAVRRAIVRAAADIGEAMK